MVKQERVPIAPLGMVKQERVLIVPPGHGENMEKIRIAEGILLKADSASQTVTDKLFRLMENMVTYSDNESFNEMVRLQTASNQFNAGARVINRYLREQGYKELCFIRLRLRIQIRKGLAAVI